MERAGNALLILALVFVYGLAMAGQDGGSDASFMLRLLLVTAIAGASLRAVGRRHERAPRGERWTGEAAHADVASPPDPRWRGSRTVHALGRVEIRELLANPWFMLGIAFSVLEILLFGFVFSSDYGDHWWQLAASLTLGVHPIVGMTMVATHRGVTRARRDGCAELFETCPMDPAGRLVGHLRIALVAAPVTVLVAIVLFVTIGASGDTYGTLDGRLALVLATCATFGVGAVALGVALGRWAPFALSPVVALFVIIQIDSLLLDIGDDRWSTDRYLATFDGGDAPTSFPIALPLLAQLGWFAALTVVVGAIGLLGRHRIAAPALAGGAVAAVTAAVLVAAPMRGVDALASKVLEPEQHDECVQIPRAIDVCAPSAYRELVDSYVAALVPTALALPDRAPTPRTFRVDLLGDGIDRLPIELAEAIGAPPPQPADVLLFSTSAHRDARTAGSFRLAAYALGLPTEADEQGRPTSVAGRAEGVAVLWLGTRQLTGAERIDALTINPDDHAGETIDATIRGQVWPEPCNAGPGVLLWSPEDVEAAFRLFALPDAEVRRALHESWEDLDEMSTDDLLALLDVSPVGPPSSVEERPHVCPY